MFLPHVSKRNTLQIVAFHRDPTTIWGGWNIRGQKKKPNDNDNMKLSGCPA
jgi:hypothetical protein